MSADMYVVVPIWRGCWVWNHGVCRGCSPYVTEPVDVMLVVTGRVLYVVGGLLYVCTGVIMVVVCGGVCIIIYDSVDGGG